MVRFLGVVIGLIFLLTLIGGSMSSSDTLDLQIEVTMACENFVKERLKAPGSAKFAGLADQEVFRMPDGSYSVLSWVDAQNSYGALLRTKYGCSVRQSPNGQWQLQELEME